MDDKEPIWKATEGESPPLRNFTTQFFAVVMMIGGVLGLVLILLASGLTLARSWASGIMTVLMMILFVWATAVGVGLWRGTPFGRRWAPVVFATQIPVFALPVLNYYWFTGLTIGPVVAFGGSNIVLNLGMRIGAGAQVTLLPGGDRYAIGVNLFSLAAAILIYRATRALERARNQRD